MHLSFRRKLATKTEVSGEGSPPVSGQRGAASAEATSKISHQLARLGPHPVMSSRLSHGASEGFAQHWAPQLNSALPKLLRDLSGLQAPSLLRAIRAAVLIEQAEHHNGLSRQDPLPVGMRLAWVSLSFRVGQYRR